MRVGKPGWLRHCWLLLLLRLLFELQRGDRGTCGHLAIAILSDCWRCAGQSVIEETMLRYRRGGWGVAVVPLAVGVTRLKKATLVMVRMRLW